MNAERILITGGAGFIGSRLARHFAGRGCAVTILDSLAIQIHGATPRGLDWMSGSGIVFLKGSVTSRSDWQAALNGVDQVVHFAAETGTGQSMYEVERYCATNIMGTALLLDVLGSLPEKRVRRVILASSRSVYGEGAYCCRHCDVGRVNPDARPLAQLRRNEWEPKCPRCGRALDVVATREDDVVRPASIYAATKHAQEELVRIGCAALGVGHVIYRFQNVYGEGQSLQNPYTGILSIFSTRIRRGLELPIFEDGRESRDFVHVDDVVAAVSLGIEAQHSADDVFNVGSGIGTSVHDLARELSCALGREPRIKVTGQFRVGDIRHNVADLAKIEERFGFVPAVPLAEGLRRFAGWVESEPLPEDRLDEANRELQARKLMG